MTHPILEKAGVAYRKMALTGIAYIFCAKQIDLPVLKFYSVKTE